MQANTLSSFDVLHLSVVYWNTILQILRSSHDEFKATMQETIKTYDNIVFNIVYNSLSCVLFAMKPNDCDKSATTMRTTANGGDEVRVNGDATIANGTIWNQAEWKIGWLQTGDFDCDNNILFRKKMLNGDATVAAELASLAFSENDNAAVVNGCHTTDENGDRDSIHSDTMNDVCVDNLVDSAHSDGPSGVLHIQDDISYNSVINNSHDAVVVQKAINENGIDTHPVGDIPSSNGVCGDGHEADPMNGTIDDANEIDHEPSLIYRVKTNGLVDAGVHTVSNACGDPSDNHGSSFFNGVQKINEFISTNVINILVSAANASLGNNNEHLNGHEEQVSTNGDDAEQARIPQFFTVDQLKLVHSTEHKKLLMQLFEITLGVMMCNAKSENAGMFDAN